MDNKGLFYCYDKDKCFYLLQKGFRYLTKAKHYKTNRLFTLWEITEELNAAIKKYDSH
ncbi:hypothetical protein LAV77_04960 [Priestia megaterium]|uniref:hypothetical protein n=1 Tax=Priestia megaterium TaxID=1404 RepID=UPI002B2542E6|nr:hypothetical protein [Priestia megaterium]MEB2264144.1 hypothetical protein [Priestia megaterium]